MREGAAISFRKDFESCCFQMGAKFSHHRAKSGQVDSFELGSSGAELLEQTKEVIRSAPDRNSGETLGVGEFCIRQQLFRGQSQQETQVLPRSWQNLSLRGEKGAQIRRRDELQTEIL